MPRPQLNVRRLMILIAVVGLGLGVLVHRRATFRRLAAHHERNFFDRTTYGKERIGTHIAMTQRTTPLGEWHQILARKYRRAAEWPWMPISPDLRPPRPGDVLIYDPDDFEAEPHFGSVRERRQAMIAR